MKNKIISRIIYSIIMIMISFIIFAFAIFKSGNNQDYLVGLGVGFLMVNIIMIYKNIKILKNPKKLKELRVVENDERIIKILKDSYAMTFRITLFIESFTTMIIAILGNRNISYIMGLVIGFQLIIFLVTYIIYSKKN